MESRELLIALTLGGSFFLSSCEQKVVDLRPADNSYSVPIITPEEFESQNSPDFKEMDKTQSLFGPLFYRYQKEDSKEAEYARKLFKNYFDKDDLEGFLRDMRKLLYGKDNSSKEYISSCIGDFSCLEKMIESNKKAETEVMSGIGQRSQYDQYFMLLDHLTWGNVELVKFRILKDRIDNEMLYTSLGCKNMDELIDMEDDKLQESAIKIYLKEKTHLEIVRSCISVISKKSGIPAKDYIYIEKDWGFMIDGKRLGKFKFYLQREEKRLPQPAPRDDQHKQDTRYLLYV